MNNIILQNQENIKAQPTLYPSFTSNKMPCR